MIGYYYHTAKTRALYEYPDRTAGKLTENPLTSDGLQDFQLKVSELTVLVYLQPVNQFVNISVSI